MPTIDSLELNDVITVGRSLLVHVFYDGFFQGAIHEAASVWRAKLHPVDLGDFHTLDEARDAVAKWFASLDANSREQEPGTDETSEFDDVAGPQGQEFSDTSPMDRGE
jgi:hypothetical protein